MRRNTHYKTKQSEAVLGVLAAAGEATAAQIADRLRRAKVAVSRPTVYRQLERLVREGRARKYLFDGDAVARFQYAERGARAFSHMRCEICDGMFPLECDEMDHVSQHIREAHAFMVEIGKTILYGKCEKCAKK